MESNYDESRRGLHALTVAAYQSPAAHGRPQGVKKQTPLGRAGGNEQIEVDHPLDGLFKVVFPELNQLHAVPKSITTFMFEAPHGDNHAPTPEMEANVLAACQRAGIEDDFKAKYGENECRWKNIAWMEGPLDVLVGYASHCIQRAFIKFMTAQFGRRFKEKPVMTVKDIMGKSIGILKDKNPKLWRSMDEHKDRNDWICWALERDAKERILLSTSCLKITDIVQGSVRCESAEEMVTTCDLLTTDLTGQPVVLDEPDFGRIIVKALRVENTCHGGETNTGGSYRDKKITCLLTIEATAGMVVEIHVVNCEDHH